MDRLKVLTHDMKRALLGRRPARVWRVAPPRLGKQAPNGEGNHESEDQRAVR